MKIILGASCTGAKVVAWPEPATQAVPFGKTTGWVRNGTNWAYAGLLDGASTAELPDPQCKTGIIDANVCCLKSCKQCGCPGGNPFGPGGKDGCCVSSIEASHRMCADYSPPCMLTESASGCLFNVCGCFA